MNLEALKELAAKVEVGECQNDGSMFRAFGDHWTTCFDAYHDGSLDAAKALLPKVSQYSIVTDPTCAKATVCFWPDGLSGERQFHGKAYSEVDSRALLLAYLRALIAQEESK